jgi:ornithine cyclodeaminase/alanine dehydrogenase-like protein (mu-crystallin family)
MVSCATLTREPLVRGAWLRPGTHLDLVGAFNLQMREADDEAARRAELFIDTEAALTEGGDIALAIQGGAISRGDILATLSDLARGRHQGRGGDEAITLFKSIGTAIEDLAAAILIWRKLEP